MESNRYLNVNLSAAKITILYMIFGFLWILTTDNILLYFTNNPILITRFQTYKGIIFIILTGITLYLVLLYYLRMIEKGLNLLGEKKGELEFILSNIQGIIYRLKIEKGNIRLYWISEGVKEILGYEKEEVSSFEWWMKNMEGEKGMEQWIGELFEKGESSARYYLRRRGGRRCCFLNRAKVVRGEDGKPLEIVGFMTDITDLKSMEDELRELTGRLTAIFDASPAAIITLDTDGVVTSWNKAATRIFGWSKEEVLGKLNPLIHDDREDLRILGQRLLTGESISDMRLQVPRKDGTSVDISLSTAPIIGGDGKPRATMVTIIDITEHVKLEEQLRHAQKMEAIGQLAGGIAHEFNNLITAIMGYARLLDERLGEKEDLKNYLKVIIDSSKRASELTKGLLTFSRRQISAQRVLDLNEIVRDAVQILTRLIGEDIEIRLNLSDEKLLVKADYTQIEQVLINFATNARDAMPGGGIVTIETKIVEMDEQFIRSHGYGKIGKYASIVFSDTGAGMDEHIRRRVFEPFFTTKEPGKGTGLGLALVYGIAKQHNGYIDVYSEPGKGSTFVFYLPLLEKAEEQEVKFEKVRAEGIKGEGVVLVAEDDLPVRRLIKKVLEDAGYSVIEAEDGEDAIKKFTEYSKDIKFMILDVVMPKKSGRKVYEEIIKINPDIKAIFMSGYPRDIIHSKGVIDEEIKLIMKPFLPEELFEKIRELFSG